MDYTHEQRVDIARQCRTAFGLGYYARMHGGLNTLADSTYIENLAARDYPEPKRTRPRVVHGSSGNRYRYNDGVLEIALTGQMHGWASVDLVPVRDIEVLGTLRLDPLEEYE